MAPLSGAEVTVEGTELAALTDRDGRFRIEAVPAGRAALRFYHARLDSLGFGAAPVAVDVAESSTTDVRLATPSPATFHARLCARAPAPSTGVLLGVVRNVDDRLPIPDAHVEVAWAEWTFDAGMVRTERRGTATTNANGAYALCGVPADVPVAVRATAAGHVTGVIEVDFAQRLFAVRDFGVSVTDSGTSVAGMARLDSAAVRGDSIPFAGLASVRGTVRGADGAVVEGAQVAMAGFPVGGRTGSAGTFALAHLPSGTQSIEVRALGYVPKRLTLDLLTGEQRHVDVVLDRGDGQALAPVTIVGRGTSFDRTGFAARLKAGVGEFITEEQIERRRAFNATQLVSFVRGAYLVPSQSGPLVMFRRPVGAGISQTGGALSEKGISTRCFPAYWVDGFYIGGEPGDVNDVVRPRDIRGIEIYVDPATAPAIYRGPDVPCGVVLIWTKPPAPKLAR
jgi:hypothetical protein